jgi:hypothetical protein
VYITVHRLTPATQKGNKMPRNLTPSQLEAGRMWIDEGRHGFETGAPNPYESGIACECWEHGWALAHRRAAVRKAALASRPVIALACDSFDENAIEQQRQRLDQGGDL